MILAMFYTFASGLLHCAAGTPTFPSSPRQLLASLIQNKLKLRSWRNFLAAKVNLSALSWSEARKHARYVDPVGIA